MHNVATYSIRAYGHMIADDVRLDAYARALKSVVRPESIVLDIGAGTGIFGLLACKFGARKVVAVEPSDAIVVARENAWANKFADRIQFVQGLSTEIELTERADVIVSDLRGIHPLFQHNIPSIADARSRLLSPGGVLIPQRDLCWATIVEAPEIYEKLVASWSADRFGLDMRAARPIVTNNWIKARVSPEQLLDEPQSWCEIDYATATDPNRRATVEFEASRAAVCHGLLLWFDTVLASGIGFSNAPDQPEGVYGAGFFPWSSPVNLDEGDRVRVELRADLTGSDYVWSWNSAVRPRDSDTPKAQFRQSTFAGSALSAARLKRRAASHRPMLREDGHIDQLILASMDGVRSNLEIAQDLMARFPARMRSLSEALTRIGELADRYSSNGR